MELDIKNWLDKGLNERQVFEKMKLGLHNKCKTPSDSVLAIIISNIFNYFNFIFAVLAVLLILVGSFKSLTFLPVIIANTCIGIIHRIRAKRLIDRLKVLHSKKASVIRNHSVQEIEVENIVIGDLVFFQFGDQIYADAVVLDGNVLVNEALVTGESEDIRRSARDSLLSGSYISSGKCIAEITAVGEQSYVNQLTLQTKSVKYKHKSKMMLAIDRIILIAGVSIIPIGFLLFIQQFFLKKAGLYQSVTSMVAAVIGMIPEGLYLLTSVTLVIGCGILARKRVLVQEMRGLELLAGADVLCIDKTGTITDENVVLEQILPSDTYPENLIKMEAILFMISGALPQDNPTIQGIYAACSGIKSETFEVKDVYPFTSNTKYSRVVSNYGDFKLGAPEILLQDSMEEHRKEAFQYASNGYRVLALTRNDKDFLGLILMRNQIRDHAKEIIHFFQENQMQIKIISGDSPVTVSAIASKVKVKDCDLSIDMSKLDENADYRSLAERCTVFGRCNPFQKKELIRGLQASGRTVAMIGDGVNDILALKEADCSFAMFSGAAAACHASTMVLLDSDFAQLPHIVKEGRRVFNNIGRSASLFLYKNIFSFMLAVLSIIFLSAYPLLPSQLAFVGAFVIGIPGFLLSQEKNYRIIQGNFLNNVFRKAFIPSFAAFIGIGSLSLLSDRILLSELELSLCSTLIYGIIGFCHIIRICRPLNVFRGFVIGFSITGSLIFGILLGQWFDLSGFHLKIVTVVFIAIPLLLILLFILDRMANGLRVLLKKSKKTEAHN